MSRILSILTLAALVFATSFSQAQQKTIVQTAVEAGNFNTLVTAVKAAGLVDTLNGQQQFTVFAPTDEAFNKLDPSLIQTLLQPENKSQLTSILTYHVLPGRVNAAAAYDLSAAGTVNGQRLALDFKGDSLKVGESTIQVTDIQCSNGVIHVIDSVLIPSRNTIPETATSAGQFNTLLAAATAADLAGVLSGPGPFSVFAPTDDAFAALPAGTVESLLQPENKQKLVDILKYHVISGRVYDTDAVKAKSARTLLGRSINVGVTAEGLKINDATVLAKNVENSNGVIHIIDAVLIPTSMNRVSTMELLQDTVTRGAPVFNSGHHDQCCQMYMETMTSIMDAGIENADEHMMTMIRNTVNTAQQTHSLSERAWVLRRGMDSVYTRLQAMPQTMTIGN